MATIPAETSSIMRRPCSTGGRCVMVDSTWNVMAHGDAREAKWRGKLANAVGSQYSSHYLGTWCIQHYYRWCAHLGWPAVDWTDAPADLNGLVRFARKTKSGFCACAVTFQLASKRNKFLYFRYSAFFCHIVIVKATKTEFPLVRNFMKNFLFGSESKQRHPQCSDSLRLSVVSSLGQHKSWIGCPAMIGSPVSCFNRSQSTSSGGRYLLRLHRRTISITIILFCIQFLSSVCLSVRSIEILSTNGFSSSFVHHFSSDPFYFDSIFSTLSL